MLLAGRIFDRQRMKMKLVLERLVIVLIRFDQIEPEDLVRIIRIKRKFRGIITNLDLVLASLHTANSYIARLPSYRTTPQL